MHPVPTVLHCTDSLGETRAFRAQVTDYGRGAEVKVHLHWPPREADDDFYESRFDLCDPDCVQVSMLENRGLWHYSRKGITPALFDLIRDLYPGRRLRFSSNLTAAKVFATEWRSTGAERVWKALVGRGHAQYEPTEDRFYLT